MATFLQTLIPLLSCTALLLMVMNASAQPRQPRRRATFSYDFSRDRSPRDLTLQGDANFVTNPAVLRLTSTDASGNPQQSSVGRVLYTRPVAFYRRRRQANFESTFRFIIRPYSGGCGPADGITFFIAPVNSTVNVGGGNFGIFDTSGTANPAVFAAEFDVYSNEWDPSFRHVGIDINDRVSRNLTNVGDALIGQEVAARVDYDATTKIISVDGTAGSTSFEVRYVFDLSTILPEQVQVGLSGATGGCVAVHDVLSWTFYTRMVRA